MRTLFLVTIACLCSHIGYSQTKLINQANQALKAGDTTLAESLYSEAEEKCDDTAALSNNRSVLMAMGGDPTLALATLNANLDLPHHNYNRAVYHLHLGEHDEALGLLETLESEGYNKGQKEKRYALDVKSKSEHLKMKTILSQVNNKSEQEDTKAALDLLDKALQFHPTEPHLLFKKAELAMRIPNPFICLEALDALKPQSISAEQRVEVSLLKAQALGRMNKIREAIRILEKLHTLQKINDLRLREMLAYFYLKVGRYNEAISTVNKQTSNSANAYLVAANAAHRKANHNKARLLYEKARTLDNQDINVQIGLAICLLRMEKQRQARTIVDSLAQTHPDNPSVMNVTGIIYKDIGLSYHNSYNKSKSKSYLNSAVNYFDSAATLRPTNKAAYLGNKALALFYLDKVSAAAAIWSQQKEVTSQNNLALLEVSQSKYRQAYNRLDSLVTAHSRRSKKRHSILDHNLSQANYSKRLSNNYKFITYYLLNESRPQPTYDNPFDPPVKSDDNGLALDDYVLEYSDEVCEQKERAARKKKRKRKRFRLFSRKNKKYKGQCPEF